MAPIRNFLGEVREQPDGAGALPLACPLWFVTFRLKNAAP